MMYNTYYISDFSMCMTGNMYISDTCTFHLSKFYGVSFNNDNKNNNVLVPCISEVSLFDVRSFPKSLLHPEH